MRDYEHEKWIPWYVDDTEGWLELSLAARGAAEGIARKMNGAGELFLRRGLSGLAVKLGRPWEECEPAVAELIAKGRIAWDGSRFVLSDPEYTARKRKGSADRMREHRAKKNPDIRNGDAGDVTSVTSVTGGGVTDVTPVLVSSDLISSGSDLGSQIASWWFDACDLVEQNTGVTLPRQAAWLKYWGHRTKSGKPMGKPDAVYWLTSVEVKELAKQREERAHREQRDKDFDAARRERKVDYTPKYEQPTKAESIAMAHAILGRKVGT